MNNWTTAQRRAHSKMHVQERECLHCGKKLTTNLGAFRVHLKFCVSGESKVRFWEKVDKALGPEGCWPYLGYIKWDGYGWVNRNGKNMTAHRYAWIVTNGPVPGGKHLLHTCDNPPCCNPMHLRLGTHSDNMADMKAKGRVSKGYRSKGHSVLHPERVRPVKKESAA